LLFVPQVLQGMLDLCSLRSAYNQAAGCRCPCTSLPPLCPQPWEARLPTRRPSSCWGSAVVPLPTCLAWAQSCWRSSLAGRCVAGCRRIIRGGLGGLVWWVSRWVPQCRERHSLLALHTCKFSSQVTRPVPPCRVPEDCPQHIADLISACMRYIPAQRPTTQQVVEALSQDGIKDGSQSNM